MTRRYRVVHRTEYRYGASMTDGYSVAMVTPRSTVRQRVVSSEVNAVPEPDERDERNDQWGNHVLQFGVHHAHDASVIESIAVVDLDDAPEPIDDTPWEDVAAMMATIDGDASLEVRPFLASSAFIDLVANGDALSELARSSFTPGLGVIDGARRLCEAINEGFDFDPTFSEISTPVAEVLMHRRGVCQDFAHLAIGALRSIGLAARYVSGYIETEPPPGVERLVGADASHAWCSIWSPLAGWVDFDPTNGHLPVERHVTVAWGRDYADVVPVRGVVIGPAAAQQLTVSVDVASVDVNGTDC